MALNPFQAGQQFQLAQEARQLDLDAGRRRESGIEALAAEFGQTALAPQERAAVEGSDRAERKFTALEQQRALENERQATENTQADVDRKRAQALDAAKNVVGFFKAGIANGQDIGEIGQRAGPALEALGVPADQQGQLLQMIQDDPEILTEFEGAITQDQKSTTRRVVGNPVPVRIGDQTGFLTTFSDGTTEVRTDIQSLAAEQAGQRIVTGERRADIAEERLGQQGTELQRKQLKDIGTELTAIDEERNFNETTLAAAQTVTRDLNSALELSATIRGFDFPEGEAAPQSTLDALTRMAQAQIPGSKPADVQNLIDSVKSNIGIDTLLRIKRSGAGLGQVPQSQLETLQSVLGNLNLARRPDLLQRDLEDVRSRYNTIIQAAGDDIGTLNARTAKLDKRRRGIEEAVFGEEVADEELSIDDLINQFATE